MSDRKTDEEIILLYKNGEEKMFRELINRYNAPLYNFIAYLTSRNDAPDIVQEIFIKVWKNINRFDAEKASFKTWIFTIAKNTATDFRRKKKSLLFSDLNNSTRSDIDDDNSFEENIPDEDLLLDEALQKIENSEFLNKILEKLRPDYREILILHYQAEMTFEEIGKILAKPQNTIKSSHRRAIMELRKIIFASPL